jgi:predicted nucleic acid-binding protein
MEMNLLDQIPEGVSVFIDSNPIIYVLEDHPLAKTFLPLFEAAEAGRNELVISPITLAEVVGGPLRKKQEILAERYATTLTEGLGIRLRSMDAAIAMDAARLRIRYQLKLPDAIQLATAIDENCHSLVTHDRDFSRVKELPILGNRS